MTESTPTPYYRAHLFFCTHRKPPDNPRKDCARYDAAALAQYLKARIKEQGLKQVRVNTAGCLHRCSLGPVLVVYPEGVWYTYQNEADLDEILDSHLIRGQPVRRLLLPERGENAEVHGSTS